MVAMAKAALIAMLVSVFVLAFPRIVGVFPFYLVIVAETFNLANIAAGDNYVKDLYYQEAFDSLQNRKHFDQNPISIEILNADGLDARGENDEYYYETFSDNEKPYRQRGKPLTVTISATYPFEFELWGNTMGTDIELSFTMTTIGLKYYKDLDWNEDLY